ncbi:MAG TPA: hypothetical protein VIY08_12420 [Candidatus Nitrosocosmicus sp.]
MEKLIIKKSGIKYHYTHIYHILQKWGFKQNAIGKYMLILHPWKRKRISKKGHLNIYGNTTTAAGIWIYHSIY